MLPSTRGRLAPSLAVLVLLVSGVEPLAPLATRDETWGDMGQLDARFGTARFYQTYFGQLHDGTDRTFHGRVVNELRSLIRERPATRDLAGSELFTPSGGVQHPRFAGDTPFESLAAIRRAYIELRLAARFRPDPAARERFEHRAARDMVAITGQRGPHFAITPETVFGFVGNIPAAIAWQQGVVEEAFLIFE